MSMSDYKEYKSLSETYRREIDQALTEFLFGNEENLDPLHFNDPRVEYYVVEREPSGGGRSARKFDAEQQLFERFWPPVAGPQVLHIVGGSGSGKSTFTRYFFQYFLPHYETLLNGLGASSQVSIIHTKALRRHILLWADLRRQGPDFRPFVFKKLGKSLHHVAKRLGFVNDFEGEYTEDEVWDNISQLANETEGEERKWYISWVFDNPDQLNEGEQLDLAEIVFAYIPEEPSNIFATKPVLDGQRRELWRIVIPVRPETRTNLAPLWDPFPNKDSIDLARVRHDTLIEKRADFVLQMVSTSMRHHQSDPFRITRERADFELGTPKEMAKGLREDILAANRLEQEYPTSHGAMVLLDQLVNDSARRRVILLPRIALSPVFRERRALGITKNWTPLVTPFYFFDGLIRGDAAVFSAHAANCLILNLYDLGATATRGQPHSIFVGLHAIYLLTRCGQWIDVKASLGKIGYGEGDVAECEQWFVNKELIKKLWGGGYRIESSVVKGHWELLKERAYTDNMAVACANSWGSAEKAPPTNPLDSKQLLLRFGGSLWFMKTMWDAERALPVYTTDVSSHWDTFGDFAKFHKQLGLPSVMHYVAAEYMERIQKLPERYERPREAIETDEPLWQKDLDELRELVKGSGRENALDARQD
jgi:hypothetical protein